MRRPRWVSGFVGVFELLFAASMGFVGLYIWVLFWVWVGDRTGSDWTVGIGIMSIVWVPLLIQAYVAAAGE